MPSILYTKHKDLKVGPSPPDIWPDSFIFYSLSVKWFHILNLSIYIFTTLIVFMMPLHLPLSSIIYIRLWNFKFFLIWALICMLKHILMVKPALFYYYFLLPDGWGTKRNLTSMSNHVSEGNFWQSHHITTL